MCIYICIYIECIYIYNMMCWSAVDHEDRFQECFMS